MIETAGSPLGILWTGVGLIGFYLGLIWLNTLLGVFLTPLFIVPLTWLQDRVMERRRRRQAPPPSASPGTARA